MPAAIVEITHRQEFSSAHRLFDPALSEEENRRLYGICATDHGHNYAVEVTVRGPVPHSGMVMDLKALGAILQERFVSRVDHRHLNRDVPFLLGVIPTAENMAVAVWREIEPELKAFEGCRLHRIRVFESRNNFVDYLGPTAGIAALIRSLLTQIGEDPGREGLQRTPERVERAWRELTQGAVQDVDSVVGNGVFHEDCSEMVLVKDIEFYSLCEHHLLPFYGRVHVGYIPNGKIIGLSKIPRIVDVFARRLQVQERMTVQIAEAIQRILEPKGVGVVADARHLCMMMRGVQKQTSSAMTSCLLGSFQSDSKTRNEFLAFVRSFAH